MNKSRANRLRGGQIMHCPDCGHGFPVCDPGAADEIERLSSRIGWATDRINYSDAKIDRLTAQLERINQWCLAYPRTVFIEPTDEQWRIANETLDAHRGDNCPSLTAISGSNMRHVVEGILALIDS